MVRYVEHPLLKESAIEGRTYQEVLAARILECGSSLVVAPTALGKTVVAALVAAHVLEKQPGKKVLFLAPTKPLAVQHEASFRKFLNIGEGKINVLTGSVGPEKRKAVWDSSVVVSATPQTIENDLLMERLSLKEVALLIFDEAHRAVKDYSYVYISRRYSKQAKQGLVLALTASPGSEEEQIKAVCRNLAIRNIEIKSMGDSDVKPYAKDIDVDWVFVELPPEFREVQKGLENYMKEQLTFLKRMGIAPTLNMKYYSHKRLLEMQSSIRKRLTTHSKTQPSLFIAISKSAALLKINHALALLETQGTTALNEYYARMETKGKSSSAPKALKAILANEGIKRAMEINEKLVKKGVVHPKLEALEKILRKQFGENPESKAIVFNHYRDSVKNLVGFLESIPGINPVKFIGQAVKGNEKGMTQKEQKSVLVDLKDGTYNTLVATSVAEEGLDIPAVDLVVFFEPVPSGIRSIQRRGRTGRFAKGSVKILMAKGTRDEGFFWASASKEKKMVKTLKGMKAIRQEPMDKQETLGKYLVEKEGAEGEFEKGKVIAYVDTRERNSSVAKLLQEQGVEVRIKQLETGDYILSDEIVVERKTVGDFVSSILDGRLFNQLITMSTNYTSPLVLVEGDRDEMFALRDVHRNAIIGAMTSIAVNYKVPVLFTKDNSETAEYLYVTAKREQEGKSRDIRLRVGRKGLAREEQQRFIVESLPSVGPSMAKKLLEKFGSIRNIVNADSKELQEIENLGKKKASQIRKALTSKYVES